MKIFKTKLLLMAFVHYDSSDNDVNRYNKLVPETLLSLQGKIIRKNVTHSGTNGVQQRPCRVSIFAQYPQSVSYSNALTSLPLLIGNNRQIENRQSRREKYIIIQ